MITATTILCKQCNTLVNYDTDSYDFEYRCCISCANILAFRDHGFYLNYIDERQEFRRPYNSDDLIKKLAF